jgi:glycine oxidase
MRTVDVIVIGQGLAGTTLAWQLRRRGLRVAVVDRGAEGGSSRIAAGLITPVTGKRLAKSWRWDELHPAAVAFYRALEAETGASYFYQMPSLRLFVDEVEREEYHRRADTILAELVRAADIDREAFIVPFGGFEMAHAARLDVRRFLDVSRQTFHRDESYLMADVAPARDIEFEKGVVKLPRHRLEAGVIAVCRGFAPDDDPWFGRIRFNAAKGEILTLRVPGLAEERVVHRGIWLAPIGAELYRAGSTYDWDDLTGEPTVAGRAAIESRLREFLRLPFEVIEHHAAVRPVIDAGYPVLGLHPEHPQLAYFNGLGSKGSLLAPFFAEQLAACIAGERAVDAEVDVRKHLGG